MFIVLSSLPLCNIPIHVHRHRQVASWHTAHLFSVVAMKGADIPALATIVHTQDLSVGAIAGNVRHFTVIYASMQIKENVWNVKLSHHCKPFCVKLKILSVNIQLHLFHIRI